MLRMSVDGVWFEFAARELVLESTFISGIDDTLGTLSDEAQAAGSPFFGLDSDFASENVSQDYPAQLKTLSAMVAACNGLGNTITSVNPNDINHD